MSVQANSWAWGCRTGDSTRKSVLAAFANHAHSDGTSSFPSIKTITEHVECSESTARRHVKTLVEEGFMRPGDQELVSHIRPDRRPVVYDLAMAEETRQRWKTEHAARGVNVTPRDAGPGGADGNGVSERHPVPGARGVTGEGPQTDHGVSHGVSPVHERGVTGDTQTEENLRTTPQPPAERGAPDDSGTTTAGAGCAGCRGQRPCRACGTTPRQIEQAERQAAENRRRRAADAEIQADRRRKAETADVDAHAHAAEARRKLREAVPHG